MASSSAQVTLPHLMGTFGPYLRTCWHRPSGWAHAHAQVVVTAPWAAPTVGTGGVTPRRGLGLHHRLGEEFQTHGLGMNKLTPECEDECNRLLE